MTQLALPLSLDDHAVFESFWTTGNEALVSYLARLAESRSGPGGWIRGAGSTGKTHLLQALCSRFGDDSVFLPLNQLRHVSPDILEDVANRRCVCLDDVDLIAADEGWELALFTLWNQIADRDGLLVVTASTGPRDCGFALADLQSRLARLPVFQVEPLDEANRILALQLRASHRGLELPDDTARFLLTRSRRDMASLYELLDRLDAEALKAQRRLTIPFVRNVLLDASSA